MERTHSGDYRGLYVASRPDSEGRRGSPAVPSPRLEPVLSRGATLIQSRMAWYCIHGARCPSRIGPRRRGLSWSGRSGPRPPRRPPRSGLPSRRLAVGLGEVGRPAGRARKLASRKAAGRPAAVLAGGDHLEDRVRAVAAQAALAVLAGRGEDRQHLRLEVAQVEPMLGGVAVRVDRRARCEQLPMRVFRRAVADLLLSRVVRLRSISGPSRPPGWPPGPDAGLDHLERFLADAAFLVVRRASRPPRSKSEVGPEALFRVLDQPEQGVRWSGESGLRAGLARKAFRAGSSIPGAGQGQPDRGDPGLDVGEGSASAAFAEDAVCGLRPARQIEAGTTASTARKAAARTRGGLRVLETRPRPKTSVRNVSSPETGPMRPRTERAVAMAPGERLLSNRVSF